MPFVLDNSVACGWFLENQTSAYSDSIIERLRDDRAVVPVLWELELWLTSTRAASAVADRDQ